MSERIADDQLAAIEAAAKEMLNDIGWPDVEAPCELVLRMVARLRELERWHAKLPCGHHVHNLTPEKACATCLMHDSIRNWEAISDEADIRISALGAERDHYRKALANVQAENDRLHKSLASLGWRYAECGKDGYQCGLCVACGGYEVEPPLVLRAVSK